jgi:hypothetical protein
MTHYKLSNCLLYGNVEFTAVILNERRKQRSRDTLVLLPPRRTSLGPVDSWNPIANSTEGFDRLWQLLRTSRPSRVSRFRQFLYEFRVPGRGKSRKQAHRFPRDSPPSVQRAGSATVCGAHHDSLNGHVMGADVVSSLGPGIVLLSSLFNVYRTSVARFEVCT